jgi:Uncharacterised nucleotidyltransferase
MTAAASELPPMTRVQRALGEITEQLAWQLAGGAADTQGWGELEWRLAPAVAAMHGISGLLLRGIEPHAPASWKGFLEEQHTAIAARQRRIEQLLDAIATHAHTAGIAVLALKGTALCRLGVYVPGERPMADLDLLVRPADCDAAARICTRLGYRESGATWKHRSFEAQGDGPAVLGERAEGALKIDLHTRIVERLPLAELDLTDRILPPRLNPGLNAYRSPAMLMLHLLAHTAGSMVHRGLRLVQLWDVARLAALMTVQDWQVLSETHGGGARLWWAGAPLIVAQRYVPLDLPRCALELTQHGPWWLRRAARRRSLTAFSYSDARLNPLSGLIWARSPPELWRYLWSRLRPSAAQREQLAQLARTEPWASAPDWYAVPHGRRMWRFLTARTPRIETLLPVRAAWQRR